MSDTLDMVDKILADVNNIGGVEACIAASRDGLIIRAIMHREQFVESLAAMSATILGAAETVTTQVEKGIPGRVIVESDHGRLIIVSAGPKALVIVLTNRDSELVHILPELERSAKKLKELLI